MFQNLRDSLGAAIRKLRGTGAISESNISDVTREIRMALLAADVHLDVVRDLIARIKEKSLGAGVLKSLIPEPKESPDAIVTRGLAAAKKIGADLILIDTAGRLAIDEAMMAEAERLKIIANPHALIYVADAMTGQSALETAKTFNARLGI